ncbi:MAG: cobalt ABC transporter permease [Nitrospirae bacterium]|nr:cobalt ABC transporter permease [Nitrospirota bacterium]
MAKKVKQNTKVFLVCFLFFVFYLLPFAFCPLPAVCAEKWAGVDESVVEKYAKEHGREAAKPLIDIEHGDLPLFMFLIAGVVGGFAAGYYWRKLTEPNALKKEDRKE